MGVADCHTVVAEICPVVCDKQEKSDLDTLQGSTIVISVRAVNKSCEVCKCVCMCCMGLMWVCCVCVCRLDMR